MMLEKLKWIDDNIPVGVQLMVVLGVGFFMLILAYLLIG